MGKTGAADSSDEGSFAPYTAMEKHLLAAESAPITIKALLIGSRPNRAWADPQEMYIEVSGSEKC